MSKKAVDFLQSFNANNALFPNNVGFVVTVSSKSTVTEIFKKLIDHKIQSVPVVDENDHPLCIVTMRNMLEHLLDHFSEEEFKNSDIYALTLKEELKAHDNLKEVAHKALSVPHDMSLVDVAKLMKLEKIHRVLVTDGKKQLVNVITQYRILQILGVVVDSIVECKKILKDLNLSRKEVFSVSEHETALTAFKRIKEKKVYAIAVVNDQGKLVGSISANDLKLVGYNVDYFKLLGETVSKYIGDVHASQSASDDRPTIIKCKETDTLGSVIRLILFYKVHRVYVVDNDDKPIGVVALQDILEVLI